MRKDLVVARSYLPKRANCSRCKGVIGVKYDTSRGGQPFSKTVTLTTNAVVPTKTLTIKGNVLAPESSKAKS
jgi:hypothetical protein